MKPKTLMLSQVEVTCRIFDQHDENSSLNGTWELQIPTKSQTHEKILPLGVKFIQEYSYFMPGTCHEVPVVDLIEFDDFFADSLKSLLDFSGQPVMPKLMQRKMN